jgi:hypothetical protein
LACSTALALVPSAALKAEVPQVAAPAKAAMSQAEFHDLVYKTYWLDPKKQKDAAYLKGGTQRMDDFWDRATANKAVYAPLLAAELQRADQPPNFYLDAPLLLHLIDPSVAMGQIGAAGLLKVDFIQISLNPGNYVLTTNLLMSDGVDTTDAALHLLDHKSHEFGVNAGPHYFEYEKVEALVWMLFGMEEQKFVPKLAARLQAETDNYNLGAIIHALWESVTPEGWAALRAYAKGPCKNKDACAYAREMLSHTGDEPPAKGLVAEDLRAQRRKIAMNPFRHDSYIAFHKLSDDLAAIAGPKL